MTTTEPTTQAAAWIDSVLPAELREEGHRLVAEVAAIRDQITPLLDRCGSVFANHRITFREAYEQVEAITDHETAEDVSDGLDVLLGKLDGSTALHGALSDMGIDPDEVLFKAKQAEGEG